MEGMGRTHAWIVVQSLFIFQKMRNTHLKAKVSDVMDVKSHYALGADQIQSHGEMEEGVNTCTITTIFVQIKSKVHVLV